ncbi:MAG: M1 family metallopeptidase [Sphingomonadaceae bacterium]|nr:M1 family metallopeptidase [Sphingomonadaceae bacterium]
MRTLLLAASALSLALVAAAPSTVARTDSTAEAARALAPVPPGKLTDAVRPTAYRIDLTVDPAQERFSGKVEIDTLLKRPARFIDLHGRDLKMASAVAVVGGKRFPARYFELDPTGVARLTFDRTLPAGKVTLLFDYDAPFNTGPAGMFRVKVADAWYSWTQFQSIDARAAFPGFDEPGFKVPFTVTLRTPKGLTAVTNAPQTSLTSENGLDVHRFAPTLPLPTYLMAFMVGPFASVGDTIAPTPQRGWPLPVRIVTTQPNAPKMDFAMRGTKDIVRILEDYFGQAFPYPKLDQISTPILPGAMENAGADLYNDSILILDDNATTRQKRTFGMVVAHELGHQWFGDMVTPAWWDDIWLNESFANWMGFKIGHLWRPDLNIQAGALAEGFSAMNTDALVAGRPIRQPIETNAQIDEAFDSITYGKGGHVVAMIAGYMGDEKFRDGVRAYMKAHEHGSATSADFFGAMAKVAGDPRILPAMQSFTDQQGVPLVTFAADGKGGYTVTQARYARLGTQAPATRWGIPLCVRPVSGQQACQLLDAASGSVAVAGPFVPNAGGTGYYRFELPAQDWDALIALAGKLPGGEALALDDSLFASFQAGRASPAQLIAGARQLATNPDSYASASGMDSLQWFFSAGMLDEAGEAGYRRLVGQTYAPRLATLGFDPRARAYAGEDPEKSEMRAEAVGKLATVARDPALRKQLSDAARAYLGGDKAALDPAWFRSAFGIVIEEGGLEAAKRVAELSLSSQDPLLRPAALGSVSASGQPDIARWLLTEFADPRLRTSEKLGLIRGVVGRRETRDFGFAWLKDNYEALSTGGGGIFFTSSLPGLFGGYCSVAKADEIAAFLRPKLAGKTGALSLERTIERVRSCGVLKDARGAELSAEFAKVK